MELNLGQIADAFGVTPRTIRNWIDQGMPVEGEGRRRRFVLKDCVEWRIRSEIERLTGESLGHGDGRGGIQFSQARVAAAKADLLEDELRKSRGELVPADEVLARIRKPLEAVDAALRSAPRRLSREWAARLKIDRAEAGALIYDLVEEVRAELREVFE